MQNLFRKLFVVLTSVAFLIPSPALQAQEPSTPQDIPQNQKLSKEQKQKMKKTLKELDTPYKTWLNEDVVYIISPEERTAFLQLETNEEREQFIEAFWLRRSANPDLPENDFKEEHYRRIAYANEHFASGIPGWKTDRGRIYIIWGKPDEIESHPTGGTYDRPMEEGGGSTTTYPWERWRYRYLEGIQENVELEFVDPTGSGEYHLTMDPSEKDALTHVPGAGLSLLESMGMASKADRFTRSDGTNLPTALGGTPASLNEFTRVGTVRKGAASTGSEVQGFGSDRDLAHGARFTEVSIPHRLPKGHQRHRARAHFRSDSEQSTFVQSQGGCAFSPDQHLWPRKHIDRKSSADVRRFCDEGLSRLAVFLSREATFHLSKSLTFAAGIVPSGYRD